MSDGGNLFDRWDLDPSSGPQAITEQLRERLEEADAPTSIELRRAWEELTMHPKRRIAEALGTFPETRPPVGRPPRALAGAARLDLGEEARLVHAPVAAALRGPAGVAPLRVASALPPLEHDPILRARGPRTNRGGMQ